MRLNLRAERPLSRSSEITHVAVSQTLALAIYPTPQQASQSWIDTFTIPPAPTSSPTSSTTSTLFSTPPNQSPSSSHTSLSKTCGSHATFSPTSTKMATLRPWTIQLGGSTTTSIQYTHSTTVLIRSVPSGKTLLEIPTANATPLAWSQDGTLLAAAEISPPGGEGRYRLGIWNVSSGKVVGRVTAHYDVITHAAFTSSGNIITLSKDGTARLTNPRTSHTLSHLEIESHNPRALNVSSTGSTTVVASIWGSNMYIWHPDTLIPPTTYNLTTQRGSEGWPLCFSPDGRFLACRTEDGFDVMEVSSGTVLWEDRSGGSMVTAGAFAPDGKVLMLGRMNGVMQVWDLEEKR